MLKNDNFTYEHERDENGYKNPLSKEKKTPDPCIVFNEKDGYYYGIHTHDEYLTMYRAKEFKDMFGNCESRVIYTPSEEDDTYGYLWAPEIHVIDGVWYIYTSTHQTKDIKNFKHVICLVAKGDDPLDGFKLASHINHDLYAIDPTIYQDKKNGKLYICYSAVLDNCQKLCIQEMISPTEPIGDYSIIAVPEYDWELIYPYDYATEPINEGAYFIEKDGRLFIVYSGNGCWSNDYVFGIIEYVGGDILSPASWVKYDKPFMTKGNGCFGPGHATFFYSPDKSELWMCYHCLDHENPECVEIPRHCHCQRIFFDETGFPHAHLPLPQNVKYKQPSK